MHNTSLCAINRRRWSCCDIDIQKRDRTRHKASTPAQKCHHGIISSDVARILSWRVYAALLPTIYIARVSHAELFRCSLFCVHQRPLLMYIRSQRQKKALSYTYLSENFSRIIVCIDPSKPFYSPQFLPSFYISADFSLSVIDYYYYIQPHPQSTNASKVIFCYFSQFWQFNDEK